MYHLSDSQILGISPRSNIRIIIAHVQIFKECIFTIREYYIIIFSYILSFQHWYYVHNLIYFRKFLFNIFSHNWNNLIEQFFLSKIVPIWSCQLKIYQFFFFNSSIFFIKDAKELMSKGIQYLGDFWATWLIL